MIDEAINKAVFPPTAPAGREGAAAVRSGIPQQGGPPCLAQMRPLPVGELRFPINAHGSTLFWLPSLPPLNLAFSLINESGISLFATPTIWFHLEGWKTLK